jgi:hypothetical protein
MIYNVGMDAASEPVKATPSLIHRRHHPLRGSAARISTAVDFQARSHRLVRLLAQTLDTEAAGLSEAEFSAHLRRDPVRGQAFCRTEGNHNYSRHAVRMTSHILPESEG